MGVSISQLEKGQESDFWCRFNGVVSLANNARVLRQVNFKTLWENFLISTAASFALSLSELSALLKQSALSGGR
jgi:hypothetical protein